MNKKTSVQIYHECVQLVDTRMRDFLDKKEDLPKGKRPIPTVLNSFINLIVLQRMFYALPKLVHSKNYNRSIQLSDSLQAELALRCTGATEVNTINKWANAHLLLHDFTDLIVFRLPQLIEQRDNITMFSVDGFTSNHIQTSRWIEECLFPRSEMVILLSGDDKTQKYFSISMWQDLQKIASTRWCTTESKVNLVHDELPTINASSVTIFAMFPVLPNIIFYLHRLKQLLKHMTTTAKQVQVFYTNQLQLPANFLYDHVIDH